MSKLFTQSVANLNTKFIAKCPSDWSRANLISLVTLDGIYILKPQPENPRGPFNIELIYNPGTKFKHDFGANIQDFDTNSWKLNNKQQMEIYLDLALVTNLASRSLEVHPRRFRYTKWSPLLDVYPKQCLLAATTNDYQLLIYSKNRDNWILHSDLTHIYDRIWCKIQENQHRSIDFTNYDSLRQIHHEVSFSSLCWKRVKCLSGTGHDIYLLSATLTGDIVLWKVMNNSVATTLKIKKIFRTNLIRITAMTFYENFLILTTMDGRLTLFDLTNCFDDQTTSADGDAEAGKQQVQVITINEWAELWHADGIEISDFCTQKISEESFRIIIAKSTNICWSIVDHNKDQETGLNTIFLKDTYASIDGCDPDVTMHQMSPVNLKSSDGEKAIFAALDGSIFQLKFIPSRPDLGPECTAVRFDQLDLTRTVPGGLCTSPNGHLVTLILTISMLYEPQKIFTPTKVVLFPWIGNSEFLKECVSNIMSEQWLQDNHITSPMDACDRIDYLRSVYPQLTYEHYLELYTLFKEEALKIVYPKSSMALTKLKILTILLNKMLSQSSAKMIDMKDTLDLNILYRRIQINNHRLLLENVCARLDCIKWGEEKDGNRQLKSLDNIRTWLERHDKSLLDEIPKLAMLEKGVTSETCKICQEIIPFEEERFGICNKGHRFDRCAHSLLIIDLITTQYSKCNDCGRFFTVPPVWLNQTGWLCSFCQ